MTTFHFAIGKEALMTQNQRNHHHVKAKLTKRLREMGRAAGLIDPTPIETPCVMHVRLGWADNRRRDLLNLSPTVKALVDGLVDAGVVPDDDSRHITREVYDWHVTGRKGFTTIDITLTHEEAA